MTSTDLLPLLKDCYLMDFSIFVEPIISRTSDAYEWLLTHLFPMHPFSTR